MLRHVVIVGAEATRLHGSGKMHQAYFVPILKRELRRSRIRVFVYRTSASFLDEIDKHRGGVLIAIWNEERNRESFAPTLAEIARMEAACADAGITVINGSAAGRLVGNKVAFNAALSATIPMPRPLLSGPAFSMPVSGSSQRVAVIDAAADDAQGRYNVEFIDTTHSFRGRDYYVSLRAMAVGRELISAFPRCRPVSEDDLSVHSKNTPLDADLLNHLFETIVEPHRQQIADICSKAGAKLGAGFYAYDILPDRTGKLFVCEAGIKMHDMTIYRHLAQIAGQLRYYDSEIAEPAATRAVQSFTRQYLRWDATVGRAIGGLGRLRRMLPV